ncbi:hypothetical protein CELD12_28860 [Cellulomonas sp. NTE-D12]|nr:hypothetical protein CELD12_28860 [Cellulomonas sp. NTE-D12]
MSWWGPVLSAPAFARDDGRLRRRELGTTLATTIEVGGDLAGLLAVGTDAVPCARSFGSKDGIDVGACVGAVAGAASLGLGGAVRFAGASAKAGLLGGALGMGSFGYGAGWAAYLTGDDGEPRCPGGGAW